MEEFLIALGAALAEFVSDVLIGFLFDEGFALFEDETGTPILITLMGAAVGFALGMLSLHIRQQTILPGALLRIANIVAAPWAAGALARRAAQRRNARGQASSPQLHFAFATALTLAMVLVRFVRATRPQ